MGSYFIESLRITKLWGYRDIDITFNSDVNILIGPNGSGKTTVLNLLHSILSANLPSLSNVKFDQAVIKLRSFKGRSVRTIKVEVVDRLLNFSVAGKEHEINLDEMEDLFGRRSRQHRVYYDRDNIGRRMLPKRLLDELIRLVPLVWLPISRRLPVAEDEEERYTRWGSVESVDLRLRELLDGLSDYHSRLNALLSERCRRFEHRVLSEMLYSEEHGQLELFPPTSATPAEKEQLLGAFQAAGLLNEDMEKRIHEHFAAAEEALKRIGKPQTVLDVNDALVLLLARRTKAMVGYSRKLEEDRAHIFEPLRRYEKTVNSFLNEKSVQVDDEGKLIVESSSPSPLNPYLLSSGEKQILILLTQALLEAYEPVVYMADEPELSLHVIWQEKLLDSLVSLSGQIQLIVATHSPDIVGRFRDKVIQLGGQN